MSNKLKFISCGILESVKKEVPKQEVQEVKESNKALIKVEDVFTINNDVIEINRNFITRTNQHREVQSIRDISGSVIQLVPFRETIINLELVIPQELDLSSFLQSCRNIARARVFLGNGTLNFMITNYTYNMTSFETVVTIDGVDIT